MNVDKLTVSGESQISTVTFGSATGGEVRVRGLGSSDDLELPAQRITVSGRSSIGSEAIEAIGDGGTITLRAHAIDLNEFSALDVASLSGAGGGGNLNIFADSIALDGGIVFASTSTPRDGGDVVIAGSNSTTELFTSAERVLLSNFSSVLSDTLGTGTNAGGAGSITIVSDEITVTDGSILAATNIDGAGGSINISAGRLDVSEGGRVSTTSTGFGDGGDLTLRIDELQLRDGAVDANTVPDLQRFASSVEGNGALLARSARRAADSGTAEATQQAANATTLELGRGGSLRILGRDTVSAATLLLEGDSRLASASTGSDLMLTPFPDTAPETQLPIAPGAAGEIRIAADSLQLRDNSLISVETVDGSGGAIAITADQIELQGQARIAASTFGSGNAGSVLIGGPGGAAQSSSLRGGAISSASAGAGNAGSVVLNSRDIRLEDGAQLSVQSIASGAAGAVVLWADSVRLDNSGILASVANSVGGSVELGVTDSLKLNSSIVEASAQGLQPGDSGGNVTIQRPASVTLNNSALRADANAGAGGNIRIDTRSIVLSAYSSLSATSQSNVEGQVQIEAINQITGGVLNIEAPEFADPAPLRSRCSPADAEIGSSLILRSAPRSAVQSPYLSGGERDRTDDC